MPKPKRRRKKLARPVVLPNLSDTEDPAPSPVPPSAPAAAPAGEVPGEPLVNLLGWKDSHRSLHLNLLPRDRRNNSDK